MWYIRSPFSKYSGSSLGLSCVLSISTLAMWFALSDGILIIWLIRVRAAKSSATGTWSLAFCLHLLKDCILSWVAIGAGRIKDRWSRAGLNLPLGAQSSQTDSNCQIPASGHSYHLCKREINTHCCMQLRFGEALDNSCMWNSKIILRFWPH